jgi:hypothetical protein
MIGRSRTSISVNLTDIAEHLLNFGNRAFRQDQLFVVDDVEDI